MNYINIYRHRPYNTDGRPIGNPVLCASDVFDDLNEVASEAWCDYREEYECTLAFTGESSLRMDFTADGRFDALDEEAEEAAAHEAGLRIPR